MRELAVVIAARDASSTIGATLRSVVGQVGAEVRLDVVVVDDASSDSTVEMVQGFARRYSCIRLLRSDGSGPSEARNVALDSVEAEWVTFLDADDLLDPGHVAAVRALIEAESDVDCVCTNVVRVGPEGGGVVPQPPLRFRFEHGARRVDLRGSPELVVPSVAGVYFRRSVIEHHSLRFERLLRWSEDFDFAARYLLAVDAPVVGVAPAARYYYVVGSPGSITRTAWADPGKYVLPFELSYLPLIEKARSRGTGVPAWLQHAMLYEISWYLDADRAVLHPSATLDEATLMKSGALLRTVVGALSSAVVATSTVARLGYFRRSLLRLNTVDGPRVLEPIVYGRRSIHDLRRISYFYRGQSPTESVLVDGQPWNPEHQKHVRHTVLGQAYGHERVLWVPSQGDVRLLLGGMEFAPQRYRGEPPRGVLGTAVVLARPSPWRRLRRALSLHAQIPQLSPLRRRTAAWSPASMFRVDRAAPSDPSTRQQLASREPVWLFQDRDLAADDNAEHLYRHVVAQRPRQRAAFVLSRRSPDWVRLESEGFALVDSDDDAAVSAVWQTCTVAFLADLSSPSYVRAVERGQLRASAIVFLQHGVTTSDQSRWLNAKQIDLMVTTTVDEHGSIVDDGTPYEVTGYEVHRIGMPRHDALARELDLRATAPRTVLYAPTWSTEVRGAVMADGALPWSVPEMQRWTELALDPEIRAVAASEGWEQRLYLHPVLAGTGPRLFAVDGTSVVPIGGSVQDELVRTGVVVTDYSSIGAEAGLLGAVGVRYRVPREVGSRRLGRGEGEWPGRWATATTHRGAVDEIVSAIRAGAPAGSQRHELVDGSSCERLLRLVDQALTAARQTGSTVEKGQG